MAAKQHERQARFLPPRHDAPRVDAASLPAAGASARHNLNTQDEQRLKEGSAPTHYTFVDGAVHERPGGRRPAPRGVNETRVHECLGHADADVDAGNKRSQGRRTPELTLTLPPSPSPSPSPNPYPPSPSPNSNPNPNPNKPNPNPEPLSGPIRPRSEGRRAPPQGANATRVHECFPNPTLALILTPTLALILTLTQVHECFGNPKNERSVDQHFTVVEGHI